MPSKPLPHTIKKRTLNILPCLTMRIISLQRRHSGGGAGFFSKTLSYPYEGKQLALQHVSAFMCKSFRAHHHGKDPALGISPHTMKYGLYHQELFPFGPCKVDIL